MYVRLAFAVAAHLEPEILLVDEVLAVGDAQFQKKCLGKMEDVSREGRTVLFVSHNMGAIRKLCENCILLQNGKVHTYEHSSKAINTFYASIKQGNTNNSFNTTNRSGSNEILLTDVAWLSDGEKCNHLKVNSIAKTPAIREHATLITKTTSSPSC